MTDKTALAPFDAYCLHCGTTRTFNSNDRGIGSVEFWGSPYRDEDITICCSHCWTTAFIDLSDLNDYLQLVDKEQAAFENPDAELEDIDEIQDQITALQKDTSDL